MNGLMMDFPLTITSIMDFAKKQYKHQEIVSITADDPRHRYTFDAAFKRIGKLANALEKLGVKSSDRIGTLAWNDNRHLEIYYAVSCMGAVCHTINPRLYEEQIDYIINHAEDRWIFVDVAFVPILEKIEGQLSGVEGFIIMTDEANMPDTRLKNALCYESLIESEDEAFNWPVLDENKACALCYTSGTTGNPKGVLYSHRSIVLHCMTGAMPGVMALSSSEVIMPIVPMFHVNAWGFPYSAVMVGAKLVLPGPKMGDGEVLQDLIEQERVTISAAVPTVWLSLLAYLGASGKSVASLKRAVVGGAACPQSLIDEFDDKYGVFVQQGWGMTELSPLGTIVPPSVENASYKDTQRLRSKVGKAIFGIDLKIVDEQGEELPWDGESAGALRVRGPSVCSDYFNNDFKNDSAQACDQDGWFETGDVATVTVDGFIQITDRVKDIIKSGGEWISSQELEATAMEHPAVVESAVVGVPHPKWNERPLLCVVKKPGFEISKEEMLSWFKEKVAKWCIPDDCIFVDDLPHTATGKVSKKDLRESLKEYSFETC